MFSVKSWVVRLLLAGSAAAFLAAGPAAAQPSAPDAGAAIFIARC